MTPQEERDAAMVAYTAARVEFEAAQEQWDAYLSSTGEIESDSTEAGLAFERLKNANEARQDAVDSLWLAWRNRPDT
jgi:phage-related minor tail protein